MRYRGPRHRRQYDYRRRLLLYQTQDRLILTRLSIGDVPVMSGISARRLARDVGHEIGRTTVQRILAEHGIEPAPERGKKTSWKMFLKAHWGALAAADFFTARVLTIAGLVRYSVFFVMEVGSRRVHIAGITCQPTEAWMKQIARNLTDAARGFLLGKRYIILDQDPLYRPAFRRNLRSSGVTPVRLPARSPNLNPHTERFVLSIKSACLARIVPLGERHLRLAVRSYVEHYHRERPHQALGSSIVIPGHRPEGSGPVRSRGRLGGILNHYYREAA